MNWKYLFEEVLKSRFTATALLAAAAVLAPKLGVSKEDLVPVLSSLTGLGISYSASRGYTKKNGK